jgi:hypothetical protein
MRRRTFFSFFADVVVESVRGVLHLTEKRKSRFVLFIKHNFKKKQKTPLIKVGFDFLTF